MKKLSKKTKNIIFAIILIFAAVLTWLFADRIYENGITAGEKQGYSVGYQKGLSDGKKETVTDSEIQQSAKEIGVYDEELAQQQKKQRESTTKKIIAETVYITDTGTKYHKKGCSYLNITCSEIDKGEALGEGYTPCSRCYPDGDE